MTVDDGDLADLPPEIDSDAGARGAVYALLSRAFAHPDEAFHDALVSGEFHEECRTLLDRTALDVPLPPLVTDDDPSMLAARYNDLFVLGYSETLDRTDGTIDSRGPPVSLYESDYRSEVSWGDVNLDLARAYEYFGLAVDEDERDNHDNLGLQLEFAGYLCRREAAVDPGVARARLDFLDRHLRILAEGVADRVDEEPGTGVYGDLAAFLDAFTAADVDDLADRLEGST